MGLKLKYLSLNLLLLCRILGKTTNWIDIYSISLVYVYVYIKGTVGRYGSCAITYYFTACEIITELKVWVILRYLLKMACNIHSLVHGQLGRP